MAGVLSDEALAKKRVNAVKSIDLTQASDMALVELTRSGIGDGYAELWKRHAPAVIVATRCFTGFDPDDVAQETFLRVLQQIQAGHGPNTAFRAYAIMTARNVATNMARNRSSDEITGSDDSVFESHTSEQPDTAKRVLGSAFTQQVFTTLPTRWQEVLWYRDVEDLPVHEFSTYLGMTENATSALLKRAREGFKQAWIAANLEPETGLPADCRWVVEKLPKLTRGKSSPSIRRKLSTHFENCSRCTILAEESEHIHSRLALVLLPGIVGGSAATGYAAWLQSGAAAPASAVVFDTTAAMVQYPVGIAKTNVGLAGAGVTKAMILPVAVISVGVLATSFAVSLSIPTKEHALPQANSVAQSPSRGTSAVQPEPTPPEESVQEQMKSTKLEDGGGDNAESDSTAGSDGTADSNGIVNANGNADSNSTGNPDSVDPPVVPSGLGAVPIDGIETGIYPRLAGYGAPGASIQLQVQNELGQTYNQQVKSDAQGRWAFTPATLLGQLTVIGQQTYTFEGKEVHDEEVVVGTYAVGHGLGIEVEASGVDKTTIRVTGLAAPTKNQVVNIESTGQGTLASNHPPTAPGEMTLTVPFPRAALGDLRYWQGDTSEGPRRVWWRNLR